MTKALVLFSGGQDSTTSLYWALENFDEVSALSFSYGQKHAVEIVQARVIAGKAGIFLDEIDITGLLGNSALTEHELDINAGHSQAPHLPASYVPGRNLLFLTLACQHAYKRGVFDVVAGFCQTDFSGYPDCRRVFVESFETTISLATNQDFRIHTPLMYLDKANIFKMAEDLGILELIVEDTHTDYNGDRSTRHPWGYGKLDNEASRLRARGWEEFQRRYHSAPPPAPQPEIVTSGPATVEMMAFDPSSLSSLPSTPPEDSPGAITDEHEAVSAAEAGEKG